MASMSASKCGVSSPFTRTMMVLPVLAGSPRRNFASSLRASPLRDSSTASSRSKDSASAGPLRAFSKSSGRLPGTKSLLLIRAAAR
jgi:hypothetical protein